MQDFLGVSRHPVWRQGIMSSNAIPFSNNSLKPVDPLLSSLPPELAFQVMTMRYITVATFAVSQLFIWEILLNIFNDYNLLFPHRIRFSTVVYFVSR